MKLVLLRHATRSPYDGGDSSLSTKGRAQAEDLVEQLAPRGPLPHPSRLIASPKRRAKETLTPVSHALHLPLDVDTRLDERHQNETPGEFRARIEELFRELESAAADGASCVWLCTHLDWIEAAMIAMTHDLNEIEASMGWSAAEYKVFRFEDGVWWLKSKGQIP